MGLSFTKREIRLQSGILHYKMGFLGYKRDSHVAIHLIHYLELDIFVHCIDIFVHFAYNIFIK